MAGQYDRNRDDEGRFTGGPRRGPQWQEDDNGCRENYERGNYDRENYGRGAEPPRDDRGRFMSEGENGDYYRWPGLRRARVRRYARWPWQLSATRKATTRAAAAACLAAVTTIAMNRVAGAGATSMAASAVTMTIAAGAAMTTMSAARAAGSMAAEAAGMAIRKDMPKPRASAGRSRAAPATSEDDDRGGRGGSFRGGGRERDESGRFIER